MAVLLTDKGTADERNPFQEEKSIVVFVIPIGIYLAI